MGIAVVPYPMENNVSGMLVINANVQLLGITRQNLKIVHVLPSHTK